LIPTVKLDLHVKGVAPWPSSGQPAEACQSRPARAAKACPKLAKGLQKACKRLAKGLPKAC